jgi:phage major head subunit gpT-like protein
LVNDDLGVFNDVTRRCGMAAAEFQRQYLVNLLTTTALGPTMSDGVALFDATHGNINSVAAAISFTSLTAARLLMRNQVGPGGGLISVVPRYLAVPSSLETLAEQQITQVQATQTSNVNPFAYLNLVVEPRLVNATRWYLVADPALIDGLEYAYLSGAPGPVTESQVGFNTDGISIKTRLDFGAGFVEWRGWATNAGL